MAEKTTLEPESPSMQQGIEENIQAEWVKEIFRIIEANEDDIDAMKFEGKCLLFLYVEPEKSMLSAKVHGSHHAIAEALESALEGKGIIEEMFAKRVGKALLKSFS